MAQARRLESEKPTLLMGINKTLEGGFFTHLIYLPCVVPAVAQQVSGIG